MWIRIVNSKADPAKVADVRNIYNSQKLSDFFESQKGYVFHYLLESNTVAGDIVFLTAWNTLEDMDAAFAGDAYKENISGIFKPYLVAPSQRNVYEVRK